MCSVVVGFSLTSHLGKDMRVKGSSPLAYLFYLPMVHYSCPMLDSRKNYTVSVGHNKRSRTRYISMANHLRRTKADTPT